MKKEELKNKYLDVKKKVSKGYLSSKKRAHEKYLNSKKKISKKYLSSKEKASKKYLDSKEKFDNVCYRIDGRLLKRHAINFKNKSVEVTIVQLVLVLLFFAAIMVNFDAKVTGFLIKGEETEVGTSPVSAPSPPSSGPVLNSPSVSTSSPSPISAPASPLPESPPPNFQGLPVKLSNEQIIKDFPDKAVASLRFFTFVGGQRVWQNEYIIKKASVVGGKAEKPDVIMILHSKYVNRIYTEDFCIVIQDAKKNGDLGFETQLNEIALVWKFKSIIKYRSCIS